MPSIELLARYAEIAVRVGVGVRRGDRLVVRSSVQAVDLTRLVVERAYAAGAVSVDVLWTDEDVRRARFTKGSAEASEVVSSLARFNMAAFEAGDHFLTVVAEDPDALAGLDVAQVGGFQRLNAEFLEPMSLAMAKLARPWSIIAAPTPAWAAKVFPDIGAEEAVEKLWTSVFRACRVNTENPVAEWERHLAELATRSEYLTSKRYNSLRYEAPGTDLVLGLPEKARWQGGARMSPDAARFAPNIPCEEVFTAPHRLQADGTVTATKPLSLFGNLVDEFSFEVRNGTIVNATAARGQDVLDQLLATDDGSTRFGEAAMVPISGAVAAEGLVWNNTLYDENDGCHIAIGRAYPTSLEGGTVMSPEDRLEAGLNHSTTHVDFVVGSEELTVYGVHADGGEEPIIAGGEWAFGL